MSNQPASDRALRGALSLPGVNAGASRGESWVKCALIFRATEIWGSSTAQTLKALQQARNILDSGGSDAARMAALIASGNPTIAAAAPAVPNDSDTQYAVNTTLTSLQ